MIIDEKILYKVNPSTLKYYREIGYECEPNQLLEIRVLDLPKTSSLMILAKCDICGSEKNISYKNYIKNTKNFELLYSCKKCSSFKSKATKLEKYGDQNYQNIEAIKKTKLERYGDQNYTGREKAKNTCILRYGVDNPSKLPSVKDKRKNTNIKNWGVDCVFKSEEIKSKISQTVLEKYGEDWYSKSKDFKDKYIKFCEKLGVSHYSKSEEYKEKFEKTNLIKFGFKTSLLSPEIIDKIKMTNLSKYGNESPMRNEQIKIKSTKSSILDSNFFIEIGYEFIEYDFKNSQYSLRNIECGHEFKIEYDLFRSRIKHNNNSCLVCFPKSELSSIKEKEIKNWLDKNSIEYITNDRTILVGKEIDIYIPDHNLAIEFNGLYWHSDKFKDKKYHYEKTIGCKSKGVSLIHIWEDDWSFKKDIIKSIILNRIGKTSEKIFARKCELKVINNSESNKFLNENHIQGGVNAQICLSLFYNNEIVSVMTFGKRRLNNKDTFELIRFANKKNINVLGASSKIFSYFLKNYNFNEIVSYSDSSIFNGGMYEKLGFKNMGETNLNYYWTDLKKRYHRFNFNKKRLIKLGFDANLTEDQIMKNEGYFKIWSCGQIKWVYSKISTI